MVCLNLTVLLLDMWQVLQELANNLRNDVTSPMDCGQKRG